MILFTATTMWSSVWSQSIPTDCTAIVSPMTVPYNTMVTVGPIMFDLPFDDYPNSTSLYYKLMVMEYKEGNDWVEYKGVYHGFVDYSI